jgi:hypothetical protein
MQSNLGVSVDYNRRAVGVKLLRLPKRLSATIPNANTAYIIQ